MIIWVQGAYELFRAYKYWDHYDLNYAYPQFNRRGEMFITNTIQPIDYNDKYTTNHAKYFCKTCAKLRGIFALLFIQSFVS